jgi:Fe-S cluster assembly scaffold protein SufB
MCIPFIAPLSNLPTVTAQKFIEGKNVSSKIFGLNPSVSNISITGVTTSNIKESDVTEYYSKPSSIQKSLSTKTITINTAAGNTWAKVFGGTNDDIATSIQQTSDGGYIVGGYTISFGAGSSDFLVIKLGSDGSLSWAKTFGGTNDDWATSIQQTSDGGYIVGGTTYSFRRGTEKDILLLKLDSNGNLPNANCNNLIVLTNLSVKLTNPSARSAELNIKTVSISLNTPKILGNFQNIQFETICEGNILPFPPKDLKAMLSGNSVVLSWSPSPQGTYPIGGYAIYRGTSSGMENSKPVATVDSLTLKFTDTNINLTSNITYFYYVRAFDDQSPPHYSDPSNEVSINIVSKTILITLQINNSMMTVNGKSYEIDPGRGTKPVIKNSRTLVPIRAIVEALGGTITWIPVNNGIAVTIKLGSVVINLQTGKPTATVNGKIVYIDSDNHKVVPEIINNRTMLPIRFIAERLGAKVDWDPNTQTITITYKP